MNKNHLAILQLGVEAWNAWRQQNPNESPDLNGAKLNEAKLNEADLNGAQLYKANLIGANLNGANLAEANLNGANLARAKLNGANLNRAKLNSAKLNEAHLNKANLNEAHLFRADLTEATLNGASLKEAILNEANLNCAKLIEANLYRAVLVKTDLRKANLTGCLIYGLSAWDVQLDEAIQTSLRITPYPQPEITVDNLAVAQFIYLLLNNRNIRQVIDTITSKVVLILGRFTPKRKAVLEAIRAELRQKNYSPILFDFEKPASRDLTETIVTLAHMARFIIADITDAKSIPQELKAIVPDLPSVPVQPLILASQEEYSMFESIRRYPWVLEPFRYNNQGELLDALKEKVINPAEQKADEQRPKSKGTAG